MGICQVEKVVGGFQAEGMAGGPGLVAGVWRGGGWTHSHLSGEAEEQTPSLVQSPWAGEVLTMGDSQPEPGGREPRRGARGRQAGPSPGPGP